MKPPSTKAKRRPVKAAVRVMEPSPKNPDALGELVNFLRGQWLRSYVLFSALGCERDRERMAMLARLVDIAKGVQK
jgi:hypothetical protein